MRQTSAVRTPNALHFVLRSVAFAFIFALRSWHNLDLRTMKSCNTTNEPISLTSLISSYDSAQKTAPHSKRKLSLKPRFGHRHEACNCTVNRVNALVSVRPTSSGDSTASSVHLHQAFDTFDLQQLQDSSHNGILAKKVNSQDSPPVSHDAADVMKIGRDRDTPLSKLLDSFIDKIDGEALMKAGQCLSSTEDDKELEMSLCSMDIDVFPLDEEDANFGLSFSDLVVENSSTNLYYTNTDRLKVKFVPEKDIVVEIPSHRMLTDQERMDMYNSSDAIRLQAFRNYAEWVWEGCDIANVVEEDKFCTDSHGNLLHPAHWADENRPSANTE